MYETEREMNTEMRNNSNEENGLLIYVCLT